jgi:hypothetical protein
VPALLPSLDPAYDNSLLKLIQQFRKTQNITTQVLDFLFVRQLFPRLSHKSSQLFCIQKQPIRFARICEGRADGRTGLRPGYSWPSLRCCSDGGDEQSMFAKFHGGGAMLPPCGFPANPGGVIMDDTKLDAIADGAVV